MRPLFTLWRFGVCGFGCPRPHISGPGIPVRVLLAHGVGGSGSRLQPRPAVLWEFHYVLLRGQNNKVAHCFLSLYLSDRPQMLISVVVQVRRLSVFCELLSLKFCFYTDSNRKILNP